MAIGTRLPAAEWEPPLPDLDRLHDLAGDDKVIDPEDPDGLAPEERALHVEEVEGEFEFSEHFDEGDLDEDDMTDVDTIDIELLERVAKDDDGDDSDSDEGSPSR
jgi:hypothetical protein